MVYIGVDLHRKVSQVAALTAEGRLLCNRRIPTRADHFCRVFGELAPAPLTVAFEATFGWGWFADLLADVGIPAHMAHPLATKAIAQARVKNDAVDAQTLAHLLRTQLLPEAWIAPPAVREARLLVRMRAALVRIRTRLKCQIHALLADQGILTPHSDLFGVAGRQALAALQLPAVVEQRIAGHLRLIDALTQEAAGAEAELRTRFAGDPRVRRLVAIPGIGFLTAVTLLAEVGDQARFRSPRQLASWAGLTPREHSSADHIRRDGITKQGSRWLRWVLVEAAWSALRAKALRTFFTGIARRRGERIAIVAVAHRLLTLCFYAWRDPGGCQAYPVRAA